MEQLVSYTSSEKSERGSELVHEVERISVPTASTASPLDMPPEVFKACLDRRKANRYALMEWVRSSLVEGVDFGTILTKRGPSKPSLWKPGAEKICGMLGVSVHFPSLHEYERAALSGEVPQVIILRCELADASGRVVADGVGARRLAQDGGDINKSLKMAAKSAHIDATLRMAGLSEAFTQDLEDMVESADQAERALPSGPKPKDMLLSALQEHGLGGEVERIAAWVRRKFGVELDNLTQEQVNLLVQKVPQWAEKLKQKQQ